MNKNFINKKKYKIYFIVFIFLFSKISLSYSENIKSVKIFGNERLSSETILLFSELDISNELNINDLNIAIKKLYETDYFEDIKIVIEEEILKISVVENPIIQSISINGIKNKSLLNELNKITKQSEKYPFLINKISDQKNLLFNIVRANGFYFAIIDTKIKDNKNNSVDIVYDFDLGERAKIQKINFIGKKIFKDSKLRNLIVSEENKPWKFITINKYLDQSRIDLDKNLLKNFYKSKGYYNVKIKSSTAKVVNNDYFVTYDEKEVIIHRISDNSSFKTTDKKLGCE